MEIIVYVYYKFKILSYPFGFKKNIQILPTTIKLVKKNKLITDKPILNFETYEFIYKNIILRFITRDDFYNAINKFNEECFLLNSDI